MFWRVLEFIARIVSAPRIRQVEKIGAAARLATQGAPEEALARLDEIERGLHKSVRSYHALTKGRILDSLERHREAESAIIEACKLDPGNLHAHLDLAVMSARRGKVEDARARLNQIVEEATGELAERALRVRAELLTQEH